MAVALVLTALNAHRVWRVLTPDWNFRTEIVQEITIVSEAQLGYQERLPAQSKCVSEDITVLKDRLIRFHVQGELLKLSLYRSNYIFFLQTFFRGEYSANNPATACAACEEGYYCPGAIKS